MAFLKILRLSLIVHVHPGPESATGGHVVSRQAQAHRTSTEHRHELEGVK